MKENKWAKMTEADEARMMVLHSNGKSTKAIARELGFSTAGIRKSLFRHGLKSNRRTPITLIIDEDGLAKCSSCEIKKNVCEFSTQKNGKKNYKRSICHACLATRIVKSRTLEAYFKNRINQIKHTCKIRKLDFDLDIEWLLHDYNKQNGRCFYSNEILSVNTGEYVNRNQLSFDRIDHTKGYTKENTVICTYRMNSIKQDLSLEEIKIWIPKMYDKLIERSYVKTV